MITVRDLLKDFQPYHSEFQIEYLIIIRNGGTVFGCYKQTLRELQRRLVALAMYYVPRATSPPSYSKEQGTYRVLNHELNLVELEQISNILDTEREFLYLYAHAVAMQKSLGDLSPERRVHLEEELWEHRLKCAAAVDFISQGRLSQGTVEFFQSCPMQMRRRVASLILDPKGHSELIEWYLSFTPELPPPVALNRADLPTLLSGTPLAGLL